MIPYILHVTVITTICFLFYKLLLQKETFYGLNRWTLMGCLAVSFALPLLPVPREWSWRDKWKETATADQPPAVVQQQVAREAVSVSPERLGSDARQEADRRSGSALSLAPIGQDRPKRHAHRVEAGASHTMVVNIPAVASVTTAAVSVVADAGDKSSKTTTGTPAEKNGAGTLARFFSGAMLLLVLQWLFYGYLLGVVLLGARFLLQLAVLLYQSYSRPVIKDGRFRIVEISGNRAPCSFGNTIFINPEKYDWETYNQILIHEKIHVSGRHTLDILLAEAALVIQWFNPFAWLYRREVENNLEFLTDAHVLLDQSIERSTYQLSLLRVSAPHLPFSITNNYNQSLLKRRIVMMNSQRSSLSTVWKYFFLLPLLIGLMCVLNKPAVALGAATTKLSMAHAPLFNLIAPIHDTVKRPVKAPDSASTAVPAPAKAGKASSGQGSSQGASDSYGNSSGDGNSSTTTVDDGYSTAITINGGAEPNPQAFAMTMDGYNEAVKTAVKVKSFTKNVSVDDVRAFKVGPVNTDINVTVDPRIRADVKVIDLPRFAFMDDSMLIDGSWYATSYGDRLGFELKAGDDDHFWSYTIHVDKSEINPFPGQGTVEFKLVREAGTMVFKGQFDGQEGFGHFHFTPDAAYIPA
ncbi:MAG TPA: M56 family metallopeptidase, partial [Puia sp.]|nr:M56 family metallopeptidase [Puia sp.]